MRYDLSGSLILDDCGRPIARVLSSYQLGPKGVEPADYHRDAPAWTGGADRNARLLTAAPVLLAALALCEDALAEHEAGRPLSPARKAAIAAIGEAIGVEDGSGNRVSVC